MPNSNYCAEIIQSTTGSWIAQSWEWDSAPPLGSLIVVHQKQQNHLGIVCEIETGSIEPGRQPFAYQKSEEELRREQPQIFEFLRTTFSCVGVGHIINGRLTYALAPTPPKIHSFVGQADRENAGRFFANESYLHLLSNNPNLSCKLDELLLAILTYRRNNGLLQEDGMARFVETYAMLIGSDYRRVRLFLQRAQPVMQAGF